MLDKNLREAIDLLGGRAVIEDGGRHYILLTLKEFRRIKKEGVEGLTKQELVDKINSDITRWKFVQEQDKLKEIELDEVSDIKEGEVTYEAT